MYLPYLPAAVAKALFMNIGAKRSTLRGPIKLQIFIVEDNLLIF